MRKKDTGLSDTIVWAGVSYEGSIVADAIMNEMDVENIRKMMVASNDNFKSKFDDYVNSMTEIIVKDIDTQIYEAANRGEPSITYYIDAAIKDQHKKVFNHFVSRDMISSVSEKVRNRYRDLHYTVTGDSSEIYISWR